LRPSQFVFTFGVGAIVETPEGPGVVPSIGYWTRIKRLANFEQNLQHNYCIADSRLEGYLNKTFGGICRVFRLPTNTDVGLPDGEVLYDLVPFPNWALCVEHGYLYPLAGPNAASCPGCGPRRSADRRRAIRFVKVCSNGHMSDLNWHWIVHKGHAGNCTNYVYRWIQGPSAALSDIKLECTECKAQTSLARIYLDTYCLGLYPEQYRRGTQQCSEKARVVLRNASNIYLAQTLSFLTLPDYASALDVLFQHPSVKPVVIALAQPSKKAILENLERIEQRSPELLPPNAISIVEASTDDEVVEAAKKAMGKVKVPSTALEIRTQEFDSIRELTSIGIDKEYFSIDPRSTIRVHVGQLPIYVTPINTLREIVVQTGYRRLDEGGLTVHTYYQGQSAKWFVGTENLGEGLFLYTDNPETHIDQIPDDVFQAWEDAYRSRTPDEGYRFHPIFVWWHTLSHRIISALGIDSGYSSASIRERVYFKPDTLEGGLLLYATQRGGDGTLGGMVALKDRFQQVVDSALRFIDSCSNDPLCASQVFTAGRLNGAACYACLFVSETSCEHMNLFLDRTVLQG